MEAHHLDKATIQGADTNTGNEIFKPIPGWTKHHTWLPVLAPLLLLACLMEVLYLAIVTLAPLPGLHLSSTPLARAWPWPVALSQFFFPGAITSQDSLVGPLAWFQQALLILVLLTLIASYVMVIRITHRRRNMLDIVPRVWLLLLLACTALFCLTLLFQPALFSDDIFTYIFSGRLLAIYHVDPLNNAPIQFPLDPYLQWVVSGRYTPNFYGPLWLYISSGLVSIGGGPVATLLLFKGLAILTHLINCILVWAILAKLAPERCLIGTLIYAWNPLVVIELASSGHSEGLLLSVLFLAVLLYVQRKGLWQEIAVLIVLGIAVSINLVVLLMIPLFTWFLVRSERNTSRAFWSFCWRTTIGQGLVIPLFLPFWRGPLTFFSVTSAIDLSNFSHSLVGLLEGPFEWIFGLVDQWSQFPPVMQPVTAADGALRASTIFIFALIYFRLFGKIRHAPTTEAATRYSPIADHEMLIPGFDVLLECWTIAVFWYLVLVLGWFWPWYALWVIWIVVIRSIDRRTIAILIFSAAALLLYPLQIITDSAAGIYQPLLVFGIPLVYMFLSRKKQS